MRHTAVFFRSSLSFFVTTTALGLALTAGCAGDSASRRDDEQGRMASGAGRYRPGMHPIGEAGDKEDGVQVENEQGVLEQGDVDRALERHLSTLVACYDRAGEAQKYASGQVTLRFLVGRTGAVSDVLVIDSSLGNYPVERCLVVEGRRLQLPAPKGGKGTDFEYNLRFRATNELTVVDWDAGSLSRDVAGQSSSLSGCGAIGEQSVRAVVYIQPGGTVASAGLSSDGVLDPMAAICAVEQIRKWRLPDDDKHLVRTSFTIPQVVASLDVSSKSKRGKRIARRR